jgi:hypothetical protein
MYLIQTIHAGRSVLQRFFHAWTLLSEMLSLPGLIFLIVTLAGAWRDYVGRRMVCFIVVPYALIWCFAFSYDNRNIALAIPFAGVAAGIGAIEILGMLERRFALHGASLMGWIPNLLSARLGSAVIVLLVILAALGNRISSEELVARQLDLQKQVGVRETNEQLYAYEHDHGFASDIASDYYCLGWLPQLNRHYRLCSSLDLPSFLAVYERPEVGYALMHKTSAAAAVQDYIERAGSEGKLRLVFDTRYYRLYEKLGMR